MPHYLEQHELHENPFTMDPYTGTGANQPIYFDTPPVPTVADWLADAPDTLPPEIADYIRDTYPELFL